MKFDLFMVISFSAAVMKKGFLSLQLHMLKWNLVNPIEYSIYLTVKIYFKNSSNSKFLYKARYKDLNEFEDFRGT